MSRFDRHALYWLGERFERWNLSFIDDYAGFVTFIYGDCEPVGEGGMLAAALGAWSSPRAASSAP